MFILSVLWFLVRLGLVGVAYIFGYAFMAIVMANLTGNYERPIVGVGASVAAVLTFYVLFFSC